MPFRPSLNRRVFQYRPIKTILYTSRTGTVANVIQADSM